jgi:hypothetical protein
MWTYTVPISGLCMYVFPEMKLRGLVPNSYINVHYL